MRKLAILSAILIFTAAAPLWAADVDGISIHWTSSGSGTPAVIFVHGWTCDETSWQRQACSRLPRKRPQRFLDIGNSY